MKLRRKKRKDGKAAAADPSASERLRELKRDAYGEPYTHGEGAAAAHAEAGHDASYARAKRIRDTSFSYSWVFPLLLAGLVALTAFGFHTAVMAPTALVELGDATWARLSWVIASTLFVVAFAFTLIVCYTLMFRCGTADDAVRTLVWTAAIGILAIVVSLMFGKSLYWGPQRMEALLEATAFCIRGVRAITSAFNGFAVWAALVVIGTSCVILRNEVTTPEDLSRQLRASKLMLYTAGALLITGVSVATVLHKWPAHEASISGCEAGPSGGPDAPLAGATPAALAEAAKAHRREVERTADAIAMSIGTLFSLVLAAAYLPLGFVLRQRAYRVIVPWERTETWLAMHGFALQPTQQLGKLLVIFGPMIVGGPINALISVLAERF